MNTITNISIVGTSGYNGFELVNILLRNGVYARIYGQ